MGNSRIELFGKFRIERVGESVAAVNTNRLKSLLAYLVLHGDAPQSREHLAFLLWPDSDETQARTNLRQLLHHLRRALPDECGLLSTDSQTVQWLRDPACVVDVLEFDAAIAEARKALQASEIVGERNALEKAAQLYQDDLLPGFYDEWLQPKREYYRKAATQALGRLIVLQEQERDFVLAIANAERLIAQDPLREVHYQTLVRLHAANGDRAGSIRTYHQCRRVLRRELGVEPGVATRDLFEHALKANLGVAATPETQPSLAHSPSPLVGRKKEWQRLLEHWHAASAGVIRLAVIPGEPGIGKSRLAEELFAWCRQAGAAVATARCYAAQGRLAYGPVAEWLRSEPLSAACKRLPQSKMGELARVLPEFLSEHPSLPRPSSLIESWERRHFYDALNAAFASAPKPLLLLIDDLQWCDADSFEWLDSLFHADLDGGILVLGTVRSEETDRNHPFARLWSELLRRGQAFEVPIGPLDVEETAALGRQIADRTLSESELTHLYRSTQGNPLFVVESIRAGLDESSATAAPPRVHAVIVARLAQLTPSAYDLVGYAGAIGQAFSFDLLSKATDWDEDSLSASLEELWQRRIIENKGAGVYDFTHDRLREVAHSELSPVRRRLLHRRIARALAELQQGEPESVAGRLAAHYAAGEMPDEAIRHYQISATVAHQRYADAEAAVELRRAIALCQELPDTIRRKEQELDLLLAFQRALFTTVGYAAEEVGKTSTRALALFRELKANRLGVPVLSSAWVFHQVRADLEMARPLAEELCRLEFEPHGAIASLSGEFILSTVYFHIGRLALSKVHMERAVAASLECRREDFTLFAVPEVALFCHAYATHILWHLGEQQQALAWTAQTAASAGQAHPFGSAIALTYAAFLHVFRRDSAAALKYAREAIAQCTRYEFAYYRAISEIASGWAQAVSSDPESGLAEMRIGFDRFRTAGAELRLPFYHALFAEVYALAGQTREALASISTGLAYQSKNGEMWAAPYLHLTHGDILRETSPAEACSAYHLALRAASESGSRSLALRAAARLVQAGDFRARPILEELLMSSPGFEVAELNAARQYFGGTADSAAGANS